MDVIPNSVNRTNIKGILSITVKRRDVVSLKRRNGMDSRIWNGFTVGTSRHNLIITDYSRTIIQRRLSKDIIQGIICEYSLNNIFPSYGTKWICPITVKTRDIMPLSRRNGMEIQTRKFSRVSKFNWSELMNELCL